MATTGTVSMKIEGLAQLQDALRRYPSIAEPILGRALDQSKGVFAQNTINTKNGGVVPWRTGFLFQSFRFSRSGMQARWFPTVKYAKWVIEGTQPHTITARNARALAIPMGANAGNVYMGTHKGQVRAKVHVGKGSRVARVGEDVMFRKSVRHPGTKPNPFLDKIKDKATPDMNKLFARALDEITKQIAHR